MSQYQYVPARTNHLMHALLTMFTLGLWSPVWFISWVRNHNRTVLKALPTPPAPPQAYAQGQWGGQYVPMQAPYGLPQVYPPPRGADWDSRVSSSAVHREEVSDGEG